MCLFRHYRLAILIFSLLLFVVTCAASRTGESEAVHLPMVDQNALYPGGYIVLSSSGVQADLFGTGSLNNIILNAYGVSDSDPLFWVLNVDGVQRGALIQPNGGIYGPGTRLEARDITEDGNPELLIYRYNHGTSSGVGLHIYSPVMGWEPIFTLENPFGISAGDDSRFKVKYSGNYIVQFFDQFTGLKAQIALDPERYREQEMYLKTISTWVEPVSEYVVESAKITASARIIGISHPDTLALLRTTYEWNGLEFVSKLYGLYAEDGKPIRVLDIGYN